MTTHLLAPQSGVIYGPVRSRRLGRSLGINLLSAGHKVCTFDCLYCQYGWTRCFSVHQARLPSVAEVSAAVAAALQALDEPPQWLTLAGNGEPTLHPDFPVLVDQLLRLRDRFSPASRTTILSNSSEVTDPAIRAALARLDGRIMKLDVADEQALRAYNRPAQRSFEQIVEGLARLENLTLQALFADGPAGNCSPEHCERWLRLVTDLAPQAVQLYTLDRSPPATDLGPAEPGRLDTMAQKLKAAGIPTQVY